MNITSRLINIFILNKVTLYLRNKYNFIFILSYLFIT
jgi:hypothetical protein